MLKLVYLFVGMLFLHACSGNYEKQQKKAAELYGECDIPSENLKANKLNINNVRLKRGLEVSLCLILREI